MTTWHVRRSGDAETDWDTLFERSWPVLYRTAAFMLPPEEAEEVVQDAFERAVKSPAFRAATEPVAWLRTVVGRIAIDRLRRKRLWESVRVLLVVESSDASRGSELRDALRRLPPRQQVALVLRFYNEATYEEIASALSIASESVGPLLARAKRALKEGLVDDER